MEILTRDHENLLERIDEVPGIDKKSAQSVLGEVGVTLDEFKSMVAFVGLVQFSRREGNSFG